MAAEFIFRNAVSTDVNDVAHTHLIAFPGFFLTLLGQPFLRLMYQSFLESNSSIFVILEQAGQVRGFAVGYLNNKPNDRSLALRYAMRFVVAILPVFFRSPIKVSGRLISQFFSGGAYPGVPADSAVLRSIAVDPKIQGTGAARLLLSFYEKAAWQKGATQITLTTDKVDNGRAVSFYSKLGYAKVGFYAQANGRELFVFSKLMHE